MSGTPRGCMPFEEIGARLGISRAAAYQAYWRGMKKLRRRFGKDAAGFARWIDSLR